MGGKFTERIHLHGILFTNEDEKTIQKFWKYGNIKIGNGKEHYVSDKTINYIVKYVNKINQKHKEYESKILCSPGIGKKYTKRSDINKSKYKGKETNETYTLRDGRKIALPIYYRNKIYTEEEEEKLWLIKLDKQERWICGERIDISDNLDDYYKTLEFYRERNKELGYGNDEINWEKKIYENQRRNLKNFG